MIILLGISDPNEYVRLAAEVSESVVDELLMAASQQYEAEEKELPAVEREDNSGERELDIDRLLMAAASQSTGRDIDQLLMAASQ